MSHLDEGTLHALLDGEIPSSELAAIQTHLAECADCRARLDAERLLLGEALRLVETIEVPAEPAVVRKPVVPLRRSRVRELAWAATVVVAAGLGYLARGPSHPQPEPRSAATESEIAGATSFRDSTAPQSGPVANLPPAPPPPEPIVSARSRTPQQRAHANPPAELGKPEAKSAAEAMEGAKLAERTDSLRARETQPIPASPAAPPASANPTVGGLGGASRGLVAESRQNLQSRTLARVESARASASNAPAADAFFAPPEPISLPDAIRRLGGSLRLIEGMVPARLESQGATVRVVYSVAQGELVLSQQLVDGRLTFVLIAPQGFAPDSLARLRARVRE